MNQYSENVSKKRNLVPVPVRPKTRKAQATRQRQLDAAEALFGEKGYYETSIVDITQRAGVALGTFYLYFPSKQAIFHELVEHLNRRLRQELRNSTQGLADRAEVERVGLQAFFEFVKRHRNLYRIVQQAELVDQKLYRWYYREFAKGYRRELLRAMKAGQMEKMDPECLAYCLMGVAHFLGMRWVLWDGKSVPSGQFESAMKFIYHGILGNKA
jgi:AcrR family transcriptional regulator